MTPAPALPFPKLRLAKGLAFFSGEMPFAEDVMVANLLAPQGASAGPGHGGAARLTR